MAAKRSYSPRKDWRSIKEDWIAVKLEAPTLTQRAFSDSRKLDYKQLRNRMAQEDWQAELEKRREERDKQVGAVMAERTAQVVQAVASEFNETEIQIRSRHARIGQMLQLKGADKLKDILSKDLSVKEAIELIRLGESIERRAFSLPDTFQMVQPGVGDAAKYKSVADHVEQANKLRQLGNEFMDFIEGQFSVEEDEG